MVILVAVVLFALCFAAMSIGVIVSDLQLRGSCGGDSVVGPDGAPMSCGSCPKKEVEICPSDDPLIALAQIGNPSRTVGHHADDVLPG